MDQVLERLGPWIARIHAFRFIPGQTPLSEPWIPIGSVLAYFAIVHFLERSMKTRKACELRAFLFFHNAILCLLSAALFVGLGVVLIEKTMVAKGSLDWMMCSAAMHDDGRLQFIYYLNYLLKYYELLDTILLAMRKKPILFLHEYHHGATLLLTWSQLREHSTVQWVAIFINLAVHILMYYYYAVSALKMRVWWKKYLTTMQIIQFIFGVAAAVYGYSKYISAGFDIAAYGSHLINYSSTFKISKVGKREDRMRCNGTDLGAITGIAILLSYLVLFIRFYFQTYSPSVAKSKSE